MHEELQGKVNELGEACVEVNFLSNGQTYQFLIDTGFNGSLCVPQQVAKDLRLKIEEQTTFFGVANHQESIDIAFTEIEWLGKIVEVSVLISNGDDFLLGTALLENKELYINFKTGDVLITAH